MRGEGVEIKQTGKLQSASLLSMPIITLWWIYVSIYIHIIVSSPNLKRDLQENKLNDVLCVCACVCVQGENKYYQIHIKECNLELLSNWPLLAPFYLYYSPPPLPPPLIQNTLTPLLLNPGYFFLFDCKRMKWSRVPVRPS